MRALSGSHGFADDGVVRGYGAYADAVASAAGEGGFWVWGGSGGGGGGCFCCEGGVMGLGGGRMGGLMRFPSTITLEA